MVHRVDIKGLWEQIKTSSFFRDSFWALFGNGLGKVLVLTTSVLVARFLGKEMYGVYGLVHTMLYSVAIFSTFGLGYTSTKFVAEYQVLHPERIPALVGGVLKISLCTSSLFAVLVFLFSRPLAVYLKIPEMYAALRYLSVIIIVNSIVTTQIGVLAGFKRFKALARINCVNGCVLLCVSMVLTYKFGLYGALTALLLMQILNCIQNALEIRNATVAYRQISVIQKPSFLRDILSFSFPIALQEMISPIASWIVPVLLIKLSNLGELGLYNAAAQWRIVVLFVPNILQNVLLSHLTSNLNREDNQRRIIKWMLLANCTVVGILWGGVYVFSDLIVASYGDTFTALKPVLNTIICSTIFTCMSRVFIQYLTSINKVWITFGMNLMEALVYIGMVILLLVWRHGENGALYMAVALIISQLVYWLGLVCMYRHFKLRRNNF